ncbi:MAG: hypothetical protein HY785_19325 [Oscillatoriophycideae cyanobacterium NC_groundwater_1537_Pr4_S-0.65um_50_18]|nr:hypothetical protein [Oscillatoriophycideae cyanobacterium NC_groundwater_1537_Pr4_S-0.65um_50_18]
MYRPQDFSIRLLPGFDRITLEHQLAGQQPDNLCGPYWVAILLRSMGIRPSTPEQVAQAAGSVLPVGDPLTWLPRGASSRQDYGLPLPEATDLKDAGTSAQGLIAAASRLSNHKYALVPLQANWTADRLTNLFELCESYPHWNAILLCNLRTDPLWGTSLPLGKAIAYLSGTDLSGAASDKSEVTDQPSQPPTDWNVGHFFVLAGEVKGTARSLAWVCDTYPHFGWQGYHLQPLEAIAQALNRGDGYGGGILLFVADGEQAQVRQQAEAQGFTIACWDNGSPQVD